MSTHLSLVGPDTAAWLASLSGQPESDHPVVLVESGALPSLLNGLPAALNQAPPVAWPEHLPDGFHPLQLGERWWLLCVGDVAESLAELVGTVQSVWVSAACVPLLPAQLRVLGRLCTREAALQLPADSVTPSVQTALADAGFAPADRKDSTDTATWHYQPRWPVTNNEAASHPPSALVVGAGLAGAAVTLSLIERGWHVHLLDQHAEPAQGASALPVGVMTEHLAAHDTVLCELSRIGVPLHWRELKSRIPEGHGWQAAPVANLKSVPTESLPPLDRLLTDPALAHHLQPGGLIRPAALVQAWLAQARASGRLTEHWNARVAALRNTPAPRWAALDGQGHTLAEADHAVLTAAHGSLALLAPHTPQPEVDLPLRPVKGQMTYGPLDGDAHAPCPVRHSGVLVPRYDDATHPVAQHLWSMGSTYERGLDNAEVTLASHQRNAASLQHISGPAHARLTEQAQQGRVHDWAEVRCASLDRLPLVGPLLQHPSGGLKPSATLATVPRLPGLWTLSALGSRGLTLSLLAAQLLSARMAGGPWPMKRRHAEALDPARFALRHARKATVKAAG
ncbi:MAG TPA: FAD-dependent oxidoreductase [Burkholderiaceae bacterium]|nr:FAD-dependent oxidoreductase [Burkholderiaceae bacterium]